MLGHTISLVGIRCLNYTCKIMCTCILNQKNRKSGRSRALASAHALQPNYLLSCPSISDSITEVQKLTGTECS